MLYRVSQTYLAKLAYESAMVRETNVHVIEAPSAVTAATILISEETSQLVGEVQPLPGDKAMAKCQRGGKMYLLSISRAK